MDARGSRPPALPWWERLEDLRMDKGWSRVQLAQKAGVARTTVDGWKSNPRAPLVTTVVEVADRLGIERQEALRLAGLAPEPAPIPDEEEGDRLDQAWRRYRDDPGLRGTVLRGLIETWDESDEGDEGDGGDGRQEAG
ncbi:MAG: helix-turn-helix domain-containing protein [Pseudonocardia sp.]